MLLYFRLRLPHRPVKSGSIGLIHRSLSSVLPTAPKISKLTGREETEQARRWIDLFRAVRLRKSDVDSLTFARSSGPGGQVKIDFCSWVKGKRKHAE